ncbi:MAG: endonuclease/exonuclease/phosphatase family protein [Planctomycetes bacterium]|nr:endonuclease/exonuclease/phosphatase family protein [Planctomycetota bacterium]
MAEPDRPARPLRLSNLVALATAPAFAAAIAPHLPALHWILDLPASFAVQAGAVLLLGMLALLLARRWRLAALWSLGLCSALIAVVPGWLQTPRLGDGGDRPVTLMTMNLARDNEGNADRASAEIRRVDPDLLFLSELTPAWLAALEPSLTAYPHRTVLADPGWFGLGLFSRLPLAQAEVIPLSVDWAPAIRATITTAAGALGVLGIHTPRPGGGRRCAERDAALAAVAAAIAPLPERRLVCGDFNSTPWNRAFPAMLAATGLLHASHGHHPTWPQQWPWPLRVPIDHLLVSRGVGVERVEVGADFGSDHAPLIAELRL